ncbi:MAG TPA: hypothetical protein VN958_07610 [Chitinophagaceae bacterium]|nr:hypothetical protein [Chitinophagaceae bacterium]
MKPHSFKGGSSDANSSDKSILTAGSDRKKPKPHYSEANGNGNYDMDHGDLG